MKILGAFILSLGLAAPLAAQSRQRFSASDAPNVSFRPFVLATEEQFAAKTSFEAVLGSARGPFLGGGLQIAFKDGSFLEVSASRFRKTGQRAFRFNNQSFGLGIPLTVTMTPLEASSGYRWGRQHRVRPYAAAGLGSYAYKEESSFSDTSENLDTRHVGYFGKAGLELRLHRWVGLGVDAQYTRIAGILGEGGLSKEAGENNLGGTAVSLKVIVGR